MKPSTLASGARPVAVGGLGRGHHLARIQQLQVQRRRQVRVVQPRVARPHRVLVAAEQRQALGDEALAARLQRLRARHRPGEAVEPARVRGEAARDERDHLARDRVGLEGARAAARAGAGGAEGRAVVGVEVPLAADAAAVVVASARRGAGAARGRSTPCAATGGLRAWAANSRTVAKKWRSSRMSSGSALACATALIACSTRQSPGAVITSAGRPQALRCRRCSCAPRLPRLPASSSRV